MHMTSYSQYRATIGMKQERQRDRDLFYSAAIDLRSRVNKKLMGE